MRSGTVAVAELAVALILAAISTRAGCAAITIHTSGTVAAPVVGIGVTATISALVIVVGRRAAALRTIVMHLKTIRKSTSRHHAGYDNAGKQQAGFSKFHDNLLIQWTNQHNEHENRTVPDRVSMEAVSRQIVSKPCSIHANL